MKIKKQLTLFIFGTILIPLLCTIILPLYHYYTSPQRFLLKNYEELQNAGYDSMTEENWTQLKEQLKKIPPHVEVAVYINETIVISTINDLPEGKKLNSSQLMDFIKQTNDTYEYQFISSNRKKLEPAKRLPRRKSSFLLICRSLPPENQGKPRGRPGDDILIPFFIVFVILEFFCIIVIINLSRTISNSITLLEKNTQRIADGELDLEIEIPKKGRNSNEITSLTESLEKMRCSLKEDEDRRARFIMGLSHDLRTPVALIKGYAEAITDGIMQNPEAVQKSLGIIHTKAEQLEGMINDLINYVKLNNNDWRENLENSNLFEFLNEYSKEMTIAGDVFKRKISTDIQIDRNISVPMDKNLFTRALENLFSNALRYTKDDDEIFFNAVQKDEKVLVSVKDTGCGISPKDIEHIFDLFYRATNSRREKGNGIGLSVVKKIVETHGWTINVTSELEKGTEFTITIPLKTDLNTEVPQQTV